MQSGQVKLQQADCLVPPYSPLTYQEFPNHPSRDNFFPPLQLLLFHLTSPFPATPISDPPFSSVAIPSPRGLPIKVEPGVIQNHFCGPGDQGAPWRLSDQFDNSSQQQRELTEDEGVIHSLTLFKRSDGELSCSDDFYQGNTTLKNTVHVKPQCWVYWLKIWLGIDSAEPCCTGVVSPGKCSADFCKVPRAWEQHSQRITSPETTALSVGS